MSEYQLVVGGFQFLYLKEIAYSLSIMCIIKIIMCIICVAFYFFSFFFLYPPIFYLYFFILVYSFYIRLFFDNTDLDISNYNIINI